MQASNGMAHFRFLSNCGSDGTWSQLPSSWVVAKTKDALLDRREDSSQGVNRGKKKITYRSQEVV